MLILVAGLLIFLGLHSVRIFADDWRTARLAQWGESRWKGLYSLVSIAGFVLLVWGYGLARATPIDLWQPPVFTRHLASLLTLPAFVLLAAAYVPGTRIKARLGHPMILGVKLWALAHLLANGRLADVLLFGGFLVWAIFDFRAARVRDRQAGLVRLPGRASRDLIALAAGLAAWVVFALFLHGWLIGVRPFG
ncbi:MAG TPA: NnrU family protein [Burkholderiaceae bacterium]|jgi:uncharacterized membrane protein|nr:NnrU family protein [Burkholderiaceae bacterium]